MLEDLRLRINLSEAKFDMFIAEVRSLPRTEIPTVSPLFWRCHRISDKAFQDNDHESSKARAAVRFV